MKERLTRPEKGNKYYIRKASGGYNPCIKGTPTYADIDTLANCVGYATGRFNEIGQYNECRYLGNTNAENFTNYCKKQGLQLGTIPRLGACIVWEGKGTKAGHVAIVEHIYNNSKILTSESGYKSKKIFWTKKRKKGSGNWGQNSNYKFKGFIYNPATAYNLERTLKKDCKGEDVKKLQLQLIYFNYNCGKYGADGYFGTDTAKAVKKFQKANKLVADSIVGEKTAHALGFTYKGE
jgi:surface antigen